MDPTITTDRLILRPWQDRDAAPFAALNADPRVAEFLPKVLSRAESDAQLDRIRAHFTERGFGLWAVEARDTGRFVGSIGLSCPRFTTHFTPCVEVGWRVASALWGKGYATEAAAASVAYGFETLGLAEIVSFTAVINHRSRRVMERIGMTRREEDDFDHPLLPLEDRLNRHVLYRVSRHRWAGHAA